MVNLLRIKLTNFAGIYTATGMKTIEIDRTKSKNNIVLILGNNGSGKSSILNEITLLPLESVEGRTESRIIPNKDGEKEIDLVKDDRWFYKIRICYPATKTTKCYISKTDLNSNIETELNPNGNVSSYLDTVFNEFGISKSYTNIGYLSSSVSNLLQMKPTERNTFISEWVTDIETFLEGYKTVSKKSNLVKKSIDAMNLEIGKMMSENSEVELQKIHSRLDGLEIELNNVHSMIVKLKTYKEQLSHKMIPDDELYSRKNEYVNNVKEANRLKDEILDDKHFLESMLSCDTDVEKMIRDNEQQILSIKKESDTLSEQMFKLKLYIDSTTDEIESRYDIDSNISLTEIMNQIKNLEASYESLNIGKYDNNISVSEDLDISSVTIIDNLLFDIYHKIKEFGLDFFQNINIDNIPDTMTNLQKERDLLKTRYEKMSKEIEVINSRIYSYKNSSINKDILDLKPELCQLKCGIIDELMNYFDSSKIVSVLESESLEKQKELSGIHDEVNIVDSNISKIESYKLIVSKIDDIIYNNLKHVENYPNVFTDIFMKDSYNVISNINRLIDLNRSIKEVVSINTRKKEISYSITGLKHTYTILMNKNKLKESVGEKTEEYNILINRVSECSKNIENLQKTNEKLSNLSKIKQKFDMGIRKYRLLYVSLEEEKNALTVASTHKYFTKVIDKLIVDFESKKLEFLEEKERLSARKDSIASVIVSKQQLEKMRNDQLKLLDKYKILTNIWSPKIGYPSWKIKNFTDVLREETNKDLTEMWGEDLSIHEITIGANEFSIIVNRGGTIIGDAVSCSAGEKATLSLALSFSILKMNLKNILYNVIRLDELDGPLDVDRRCGFIDVVNDRLKDLDCQTCFIVSHNNEFDSVECDVILLRGWENIPMRMDNKNILFKIK